MGRLIRLAVLVVVGIAAGCLVLGAIGGPDCGSGMTSVACLGGTVGRWHQGVAVAAALATLVPSILAGSTLVQVRRHRRLARSLEETSQTTWFADHEVGLVAGLTVPCVAGLARSRIYCPPDLATRLRADELRAVILHERHHQLAHAPAHLILLAALRPALTRWPGGREWLEDRRAALEIEADNYALRSGARRPALARALMKLAAEASDPALAGYASASELRLRHLVGDESSRAQAPRSAALLAVPVVALVACWVWGLLS